MDVGDVWSVGLCVLEDFGGYLHVEVVEARIAIRVRGCLGLSACDSTARAR